MYLRFKKYTYFPNCPQITQTFRFVAAITLEHQGGGGGGVKYTHHSLIEKFYIRGQEI